MTGDEEYKPPHPLPRHAVLNGIGRCRVLHYDGKGFFTLLDGRDTQRFVHRDNITFLPDKRKKDDHG